MKDSTREEVFGAIAEVLTDSGLVPSPQANEGSYKPASALASMLLWHAENWDLSRSYLRRRTTSVLPDDLPSVWNAYMRLAVIDMALRLAAYLHLAGSSPAVLDFLSYCSREARGEFLNQKRQQAGLTLEDLADGASVDDDTVDNWMYHGSRPSDDNLKNIAEVLADNIEGSTASSIALGLRALYWISDMGSLLAERIGAEAVVEAIRRLHLYAGASFRIIEDQLPSEERAKSLTVLADLGVGARLAEPLLATLIEHEADDEWRKDLQSTTGMDWIRRVLSANLRATLAGLDQLNEKTSEREMEDWDFGHPKAYMHYRRYMELREQGALEEAVAELETAVRVDPLHSGYQFELGTVKSGIGIRSDNNALVEEGLNALWLAASSTPNWILPWTEIGRTLHDTNKTEEAVAHLLDVKEERGPLDSDYFCALGAALWKLDQLKQALIAFEAALELDPEETSTWVAASEIALLIGDAQKHRRYVRRAQHFGAEAGTFRFTELLREIGQLDQGNAGTAEHDRNIAVLDAIIRLNPDDDDAYLNRAFAHFERGDEDLTISDLNAVLQLNPDQAAAYMLRGILLGDRKQWDQTIADMGELIRLKPGYAKAYYYRGQACGEQDKFDLAFIDICEAIRLEDAWTPIPYWMDGAADVAETTYIPFQSEPDAAPVRLIVRRVKPTPGSQLALFATYSYHGFITDRDGEMLELEADHRRHAEIENAIRDLKYGVGLNHMPSGRFAANGAWLAVQAMDPDHADGYRFRGDCLRYNGEYEKAIADFDTALRLDPENAAAHLGRGAAFRMKGDFDQAIADYDVALRLKPGDPLAYRFRGDAHIGKGNYDQAIVDCSRALNLSPDDPVAYFARGNAHLYIGELVLALADFNSAIQIDPTSGRSTHGRGLVRELMGDTECAAEDYRRAKELGYDDRDLGCEA